MARWEERSSYFPAPADGRRTASHSTFGTVKHRRRHRSTDGLVDLVRVPMARLVVADLTENAKPTAKDEGKHRENRGADNEPKHGVRPL